MFTSLVAVLVFPAIVVKCVRHAGDARLTAITLAMVGCALLVGLALASPSFGNRLATTDGYWSVAGRAEQLVALAGIMPVRCLG